MWTYIFFYKAATHHRKFTEIKPISNKVCNPHAFLPWPVLSTKLRTSGVLSKNTLKTSKWGMWGKSAQCGNLLMKHSVKKKKKKLPYKVDIRSMALSVSLKTFTADHVHLSCSKPYKKLRLQRRVPLLIAFVLMCI